MNDQDRHYSMKCSEVNKMRIIFTVLIVILGVNLMIDLLDSNMVKLIQERNESIQRSIDGM